MVHTVLRKTFFDKTGPNSRLHCKKHPKLTHFSTFTNPIDPHLSRTVFSSAIHWSQPFFNFQCCQSSKLKHFDYFRHFRHFS
ncbi:Trafficking protein particle complex subunit 8, partial [Frankliniella fusca]